MRTRIILTASALALLMAPALAQQPSGGSPSPGSAPRSILPGASPTEPGGSARAPAPNPLRSEDVSKLTGAAVYGGDDKRVGSIETVLMKPDSRTVDRFVVSSGGVLGVGAHRVALPIDQFAWDADKGGFKIAKTPDDLKAMPQWPPVNEASGSSVGPASSGSPAQ